MPWCHGANGANGANNANSANNASGANNANGANDTEDAKDANGLPPPSPPPPPPRPPRPQSSPSPLPSPSNQYQHVPEWVWCCLPTGIRSRFVSRRHTRATIVMLDRGGANDARHPTTSILSPLEIAMRRGEHPKSGVGFLTDLCHTGRARG